MEMGQSINSMGHSDVMMTGYCNGLGLGSGMDDVMDGFLNKYPFPPSFTFN
jgi:hypothetical protein